MVMSKELENSVIDLWQRVFDEAKLSDEDATTFITILAENEGMVSMFAQMANATLNIKRHKENPET